MPYIEIGGPKPEESSVPYAYPGLIYWLDPERYNDPVAPWQLNGTKVASAPSRHNRFGPIDNTKTVAQATDSLRPTLNISDVSYGGRATLTFANTGAGTGITLSTSQWTSAITSPYTVYIVGDSTASNASNQRWLNNVSAGADSSILLYHGNSTQVLATTGITPTTGNAVYADPVVVCSVVNGASSALYNKDATNSIGTGTESTALTGLKIGGNFASSACFYGRIATILVYSGAHDAATRDTIMSWLKARYGFDRSRVPYQVGGLAYWLDPERYADTTGPGAWTLNSTKVATAVSRHSWVGTGDTSKNVTQGTDANRPTINLADAAFNGRNTLSFDYTATQGLPAVGAWTTAIAQPFTSYVVASLTSAPGVTQQVMWGSSGSVFYSAPTTPKFAIYSGTGLLGATDIRGSGAKVLAGVHNGASSATYISNSSSADASGNAGATNIDKITIGTNAAGSLPMDGKIATVLIYAGAHTAAQRAFIMQYLGNYYGITVT